MTIARLLFAFCLSLLLAGNGLAEDKPLKQVIDESFAFSAKQYGAMLDQLKGARNRLPRTVEHGKVKLVGGGDWTSGFFPGSLWLIHEHTQDERLGKEAARYTAMLEDQKNNRNTHDVGFILYCSYGTGLRLTGDKKYRDVLLEGAKSLSTRFSPKVGAIRSWNHSSDKWRFPVIIDNMMNLELLLWAARESGQAQFREIAIKHADTTLKNHFREDGSSFHVVGYDPSSGEVEVRQTHQGKADSSAWARGQAWGLYGYTLMYRETKDERYLTQARKIADFILNHPRLPEDKVPYWDFDDPRIPNVPRDSSAAGIIASALLELADYVPADTAKQYLALAEAQIRSLSSPAYLAKLGDNGNFIIMHCTGHMPKNSEVDAPINYGDYYYLEALQRMNARLARR